MPITSADQLLAILEDFPWRDWQARLGKDIEPIYRDLVIASGTRVFDSFNFDDPFTTSFATDYLTERIVQLDAFTRENLGALLRRIFDAGGAQATTALGERIATAVREHVQGYEVWRAQRIARTESAIAYNHGAALGVKQAGGESVYVTDGDQDEECAAANGSTWTIREALDNPVSHPNCTRVFSPA